MGVADMIKSLGQGLKECWSRDATQRSKELWYYNLGERTWDAVESDTLDELKSAYDSRCCREFKEAKVLSKEELQGRMNL